MKKFVILMMFSMILIGSAMTAQAQDTTDKAVAEEPKADALVLDILADRAESRINGTIDLTVRLLNVSDEAQDVRLMEYQYDSVSLKVKFNGKDFELGHSVSQTPKGSTFSKKYSYDNFTIEAGRSARYKISLPAVAIGEYEFTAVYKTGSDAGILESKKVATVHVVESQGMNAIVARMKTNKGEMVFRFYPETALNTVMHQVALMKDGYFNGQKFHRIIPKKVIQGGDPRGNGLGGPGYQIKAEFSADKIHELGVLSMARSSTIDSAGSQFFICSTDLPQYDGTGNNSYTPWGKAIEGEALIPELTAIQIKGDTKEFKTKSRAIRASHKDKPIEQRKKIIRQELQRHNKNREQPSEAVLIQSIRIELRTLDLSEKEEDAKTDEK